MVDIDVPFPRNAEVRLVFWVDRDISIRAIDIEYGDLSPCGSLSDQEVALRE